MGNFSTTRQNLAYENENKVIQELINNNCVVVFSKSQCIYCKDVERLFKECNISFVNVDLDKRKDGKDIQNALYHITGVPTVPRVFINGDCIGGASESKHLFKNNKLIEKINQCNSKL